MFGFFKKKKKEANKKLDEDELEVEKQIRLANKMIKLKEKELSLMELEAEMDDLEYDLYGEPESDPIKQFEQTLINNFLMPNSQTQQGVNITVQREKLTNEQIDGLLAQLPPKALKQIPKLTDDQLSTHISNYAPTLEKEAIQEAVVYIRNKKF